VGISTFHTCKIVLFFEAKGAMMSQHQMISGLLDGKIGRKLTGGYDDAIAQTNHNEQLYVIYDNGWFFHAVRVVSKSVFDYHFNRHRLCESVTFGLYAIPIPENT
jgi:hypothetical protein